MPYISIFPVEMTVDILIRLSIAMILGMLIGLERVVAGKTAGMRTYAMVSMGAALFIIISLIASGGSFDTSFVDMRVAANIVVGVGFLGAGLILFRDSKLVGLTSATALWVAAGIGMAAGFGLFAMAIIATILTLFIFTILWFVENFIRKFVVTKEIEDAGVHTDPITGVETGKRFLGHRDSQ